MVKKKLDKKPSASKSPSKGRKSKKDKDLPADWRVHAAHCCAVHGCKYSSADIREESDCPVYDGRVERECNSGWCQEPCLVDDPNSCRRDGERRYTAEQLAEFDAPCTDQSRDGYYDYVPPEGGCDDDGYDKKVTKSMVMGKKKTDKKPSASKSPSKSGKAKKNKDLPADWRVHATHCCAVHGCKYNSESREESECPVYNGRVERDFNRGWCQEPCVVSDPDSCRIEGERCYTAEQIAEFNAPDIKQHCDGYLGCVPSEVVCDDDGDDKEIARSMVEGFSEVMSIEDEGERAKVMADHNEKVLDVFELQFRQSLDPRHPYLWDRPITVEDFVKAADYLEENFSNPVFALANIFRITGQWCKEDEKERGWPHSCEQCIPCLKDTVNQLSEDISVLASPDKLHDRWNEVAEAISHESFTDTLVALVIKFMKKSYEEGYNARAEEEEIT